MIGVSTKDSDGKLYVNAVRSIAQIGPTARAGLKQCDLYAPLSFVNRSAAPHFGPTNAQVNSPSRPQRV
jgi:hypothetical protein